jgi:hypothetical protein
MLGAIHLIHSGSKLNIYTFRDLINKCFSKNLHVYTQYKITCTKVVFSFVILDTGTKSFDIVLLQ